MSQRPKVVVAVGEASERTWLARSLAASCQVTAAENGNEAIRVAQEATADILICEQALPGRLSGSDVCRQLKTSLPNLRSLVLINECFASMPEPVLRENLHADGVIARPLRFRLIAERLRQWGIPVRALELTAAPPEVDPEIARKATRSK